MGRQIKWVYTPPYGADSGNLGKFETFDHHACLHENNVYIKR